MIPDIVWMMWTTRNNGAWLDVHAVSQGAWWDSVAADQIPGLYVVPDDLSSHSFHWRGSVDVINKAFAVLHYTGGPDYSGVDVSLNVVTMVLIAAPLSRS